MLRGTVGTDRRTRVTVEIVDHNGVAHAVEAVVDTGFSGFLTLPSESIHSLGLAPIGRRVFALADGQRSRFDIYLGSVSWHDRARDVVILELTGTPLLGMASLWGSRVTIEALTGGAVEIEELPSGP